MDLTITWKKINQSFSEEVLDYVKGDQQYDYKNYPHTHSHAVVDELHL